MAEELAEGWWCVDCEFIELEKEFHDEGGCPDGTCISCGCPPSSHRAVKVITRD